MEDMDMYRDTTEFRKRFAEWKLGKPVYNRGKILPRYTDGENIWQLKKELTEEEIQSVLSKVHPEPGVSGADPIGKAFVAYMGSRAITTAMAALNRLRALKQMKDKYRLARQWNELTRDASRSWKIQDADSYARNPIYSGSENPIGWLYDLFGRPIVNAYDKLNRNPIIGPLIP